MTELRCNLTKILSAQTLLGLGTMVVHHGKETKVYKKECSKL